MKTFSILNVTRVMEPETILKNGASPKSQMSRGNQIMQAFCIMLFLAVNVFIFSSCGEKDNPDHSDDKEERQNTLSLSSTSLSFTSSETGAKTTTVTTNASSWNYNCSANWLKVEKQGNTLSVNPTSANTGTSQRSASISISAGTASIVTVQVTQDYEINYKTFNTARLYYLGNLRGPSQFQLNLSNSNDTEGIMIEGFSSAQTFANFKLDAGTYTFSSKVGVQKTFFEGEIYGNCNVTCIYKGTYHYKRNGYPYMPDYIFVTGGTFAVSFSGNTYTVTTNFKGYEVSASGKDVFNICYKYTGTPEKINSSRY